MTLSKLFKTLWGAREKPPAAAVAPRRHHTISNPYHAVAIAPGDQSCAVARAETGTRYLSKDAPALPLDGCTSGKCTCRYRHYDDRRITRRRAADVWSNGRHWAGQERRITGRRITDHAGP